MTGTPSPRTTLLPGPLAEAPAAVPAPPTEPPPAGPRSRIPLLVVIGAGVLVLAAVAAFVLLNRFGGEVDPEPVVSHPAPAAAPTTSPSTGPPASSPQGVVVAPTGRNPFLQPGGGGSPAGSADPSASTGASVSAGTTTAPSAATATATYVGLYGFSGSKAIFWVNDTKYQVAVGDTFAGFTYASKSGSCAKVSRSGTTTTVCSGTVRQFG